MTLGLFINSAFAQTAPATNTAPSIDFAIPMLLMLLVVYFLILRPQMRQQKEIKKMISELKVGDEVILVGGIHGRVSALEADTLTLKIASDVEIKVDRVAVQSKKNLNTNTKLK